MLPAKHITKRIKGDYRLIAIADIHGHLDRFKALLKKVNYDPNHDYLVIIGDFVEKGDQTIDTIRFVRELERNPRCFVLIGNCEWAMTAILQTPELANQIQHYFAKIPRNGAIRDYYHQLHLDDGHETMLGIQREIEFKLHDDLQWMKHLPTTLKLNNFIFVHAGLPYANNYKSGILPDYLEMPYFMNQGHPYKEMVIVGHMPSSNYHHYNITNNVIIDAEKRIISIDGGTGIKPVSQLNALIIHSHDGVITYECESVQPCMKGRIIKDHHPVKQKWHKIAYPYFKVIPIKTKGLLTYCHNEGLDEDLWIKNDFLYEREGQWYCLDDYTDRQLDISRGDIVGIAGHYGDEIYAVKDGLVGWVPASCVQIIHKHNARL